jgi:hypothetical protein
LRDGRLSIDNGEAERKIKYVAIGRKNWLFCDTPEGANASALFYSFVVTAKENGMNPYEALKKSLLSCLTGSLKFNLTTHCEWVECFPAKAGLMVG